KRNYARGEPSGAPDTGQKRPFPSRHNRFERSDRPHVRQRLENSGEPDFRRERQGHPARDTDAKGPHRKPRGQTPFTGRTHTGVEHTPRLGTSHSNRHGERQPPPRRLADLAGEETNRDRKMRPDHRRQGERPHPRQRVERGKERPDFRQTPRDGSEKRGERQHPSFRRPDVAEREPFNARSNGGGSSGRQGGGQSGKPAAGEA